MRNNPVIFGNWLAVLVIVCGAAASMSELKSGLAKRHLGVRVKSPDAFKPIAFPKSDMDSIIIQLLNGFKENMTSGFPHLGIPALEPLRVQLIPLNISEPMLSLNGTIRNLKVVGLSDFRVVNVSSNLSPISVELNVTLPTVEISGEYDVQGVAAEVIPVFGNGHFKLKLSGITLTFGARLKMKGGNGLTMEEIHYQIDLEKIDANIEGLVGGGQLSETLNEIINKHGVKIFRLFELKIHDRVTTTLLVQVNKLLEGVKLTDLLGSGFKNPVQFPTSVGGSPFLTRADASQYVDFALSYLREYMIDKGLDRIPLENQTTEFSESFLGITWYGEAALFDGILTGLETIHRAGPANLNQEGNDVIFDAELEVNDAGLKYAILATFMGFGPSGIVIGNLESIKVFVQCRVAAELNNVTLEEFDVLDLGDLSIEVFGGGVLGFIVEIIADTVGNSLKHIVADLLEGTIKSMLNDIIGDLLFPVDANNSTNFSALHHRKTFHAGIEKLYLTNN